ncbi:Transient receptor potential channel pyrexia, partial [Orchesella cincta]
MIYRIFFAVLFTICSFVMLYQQHFHDSALGIIAAVLNVILGAMAVISLVITFVLYASPKTQFIHTWIQKLGEVIAPLVAIITCAIPTFLGYPILISRLVNKDITAFGVMISWLVMLSYLTKFLLTAAYVETFFQIVKNYIEFFLFVAIGLFVALTASHSIIFHKDGEEFSPFANVSRSFIRVITGRMNYDAFTDDTI